MLPQRRSLMHAIPRMLLVTLASIAAGCGPEETPEARVRAVIARGEEAAEARDLSGLMGLVSADYRDGQGNGREELKQYLRGYLVANQSVHVLTRVDSVEFPYRDFAQVSLTLGTLGREQAAAAALDVAADVYEVELDLRLEDGDWRVMRADWRPAR